MKRWEEEMRNDESIYLMGEEVGIQWCTKHLKGMLAEFEKKSDWYSIAELGFTAGFSNERVDQLWIHDFQPV
jgi:pyruvate/2-oxoglutarate/acetoin dehydrogenase E1 component